jgi:hypothetical protein
VLAIWPLARCAGSEGLEAEVTRRRRRRVAVGEEEST